MKAVRIHAFGGPEELIVEDVHPPRLRPQYARIRVVAAGVNPLDWIVREHEDNPKGADRVPMTLGHDFAGLVTEIGRGSRTRLRAGEAVMGQAWGSFAEQVVAPVRDLVRKPPSMDMDTAASLPTPGLTAWQVIVSTARVRPGMRVLVHGAGGAVGSFCVQLAMLRGAYVIGTASPPSFDFLQSVGVDELIDYRTQLFDERASDLDVVVEHLGGETQRRSLNVLRKGGLLVSLAGQVDGAAARRAGVRTVAFRMKYSTRALGRFTQLVAQGVVKPHISAVLPLGEARQALDLNQRNESHGKIVLRPAA
jgi:NADPH:quinone reductase-like Zn-dependent oxidoreductase